MTDMESSTSMPHRSTLAAALALLLGGLFGSATADDQLPSDPVFLVRYTDGSSLSGRLQRLGADRRVTIQPVGEDQPARTVPIEEVVSFDRVNATPSNLPEWPALLFPDGDRLRASIGKVGETTIAIQSRSLGELQVPLVSVLGLVLNPPGEVELLESVHAAIRAETGGREVAWLNNGDRVEGGFLGLSGEALEFRTGGGPTTIPRKGVVALAFDPKLVEYARPRDTYVECKLRDGSRIGLGSFRYEQGQVMGTTRAGPPVKLSLSEVDRLTVRSAVVQFLSERPEDGIKYTAYLGSPRPYQRDAAVDGRAICLAGQYHERGLGTQSRTLLAYKLDASARRFQATIGLDDRAGPLGDVVFRVRVDERVVFTSPSMTEGAKPIDLDIDVQGARFLILDTDFGERGDVRDYADWAEARLVRDPAAATR
jgi:hypothetical protein